MGKIIAIANQKGGTSKTTSTVNIGVGLAKEGKKVLLIDIDPQGNATSGLGINKEELENTVYEMMLGDCSVKQCMVKTEQENLYVVPSSVNLAGIELEISTLKEPQYVLKNEVDYIKEDFDYIIIDCPPSLNMLTINAMTTADSVLVPIQCEFYALEGLSQLIHTINLVRDRLNPNLNIEGVVFTMYDARTNLSAQVVIIGRGIAMAAFVAVGHQQSGMMVDTLLDGSIVTELLIWLVIIVQTIGPALGQPLRTTLDAEVVITLASQV